jgi:hypothetical protein
MEKTYSQPKDDARMIFFNVVFAILFFAAIASIIIGSINYSAENWQNIALFVAIPAMPVFYFFMLAFTQQGRDESSKLSHFALALAIFGLIAEIGASIGADVMILRYNSNDTFMMLSAIMAAWNVFAFYGACEMA